MILAWIFIGCACFIALVLITFAVLYFVKIHKKQRDTEDYINGLTF
jgi:hypothetical protein